MGNLKRAYCKQRPKWWNYIVSKYGYTVEIYKDCLSKEEAFEIEIELIKKYGRIDLKNGQLINHTNGGPAVEGISEITLRKKSQSLKSVIRTKEWNDKISRALKGRAKSMEWRSKISESIKGSKLPESTKQKMRMSNRSKIVTAKPIICYDCYSNEFISKFDSVRNASIILGCKETSISNNLHNRSNSFYSKILNKKIKCLALNQSAST